MKGNQLHLLMAKNKEQTHSELAGVTQIMFRTLMHGLV